MPQFQRIVVLTGAGLSAESGLSTFRDKDGLWARYDYREVATPEGFARNPELVYEFYNQRRRHGLEAKPNPGHKALARLERQHPGEVLVVTQNVDGLHEAAGSQNLIHMHGQMAQALCSLCGARTPWVEDLSADLICPSCATHGGMRPDVVWFGEIPYELERIAAALQECDLFIAVGTSGNVYPAAGFVAAAREAGAHTVELNLEPSERASRFAEWVHGPASLIVPLYVDKLLGDG